LPEDRRPARPGPGASRADPAAVRICCRYAGPAAGQSAAGPRQRVASSPRPAPGRQPSALASPPDGTITGSSVLPSRGELDEGTQRIAGRRGLAVHTFGRALTLRNWLRPVVN
jgi:hypothetical protein